MSWPDAFAYATSIVCATSCILYLMFLADGRRA